MQIKVAIVEDSAGVRENWAKLINSAPGFACVNTCASGEEALKRLTIAQPDVVLMDIRLPGISGIECTARLKLMMPKVQILMLTVYGEDNLVLDALQSGASGYLLKRTTPTELLEAITEVRRGGAPMTSEIARKVVESFRRPAPSAPADCGLSQREEEILAQLSQGYSNKEIAERLRISFDTVRTHLKHVYEKLHVRSRTEAVGKYLRGTEKPLGSPSDPHADHSSE